jgi:hypothetical protein
MPRSYTFRNIPSHRLKAQSHLLSRRNPKIKANLILAVWGISQANVDNVSTIFRGNVCQQLWSHKKGEKPNLKQISRQKRKFQNGLAK